MLCFLNALMCVDSLAHGPLSALSQPMCYMAACVAARNWIDTPAPLSEGYSGLLSSLVRYSFQPPWSQPLADDSLFTDYFLLSENTDCTPHASSIYPPTWRLISHQPISVPSPLLALYLNACSPGCRSRCPGWVLVTRCARARCIVCWLFSINLSRKNGSLARRCERRSQFHTPQWKENPHGMGETGRERYRVW